MALKEEVASLHAEVSGLSWKGGCGRRLRQEAEAGGCRRRLRQEAGCRNSLTKVILTSREIKNQRPDVLGRVHGKVTLHLYLCHWNLLTFERRPPRARGEVARLSARGGADQVPACFIDNFLLFLSSSTSEFWQTFWKRLPILIAESVKRNNSGV